MKEQQTNLVVRIKEGMKVEGDILQKMKQKLKNYYGWKQKNYGEEMRKVEEWEVEFLQFGTNYEENILLDISEIKFTQLKHLFLPGNYIKSVQILGRIFMPCLKWISIGVNEIVRTRTMRKANWPQLHALYMDRNKIIDAQTLTQLNIPQIINLCIKKQSDSNSCHDLSWVFKLPLQNMKSISYTGLNEKSLSPVLKRKRENISLVYITGNF